MSVQAQLERIMTGLVDKANKDQQPMKIEYDSAWPSLCYQQKAAEGELVEWQPVKAPVTLSFSNVEKAMSLTLNNSFCEYFTGYFSHNITAVAEQGVCELLFAWNEEDFARLQENIIGHLLMKKRLKQAPTLFFALTDQDDFILTVDNATGEVMLERVGKPPEKTIAPSLAEFLATLTPQY